ncbi:leucine-rich repeat domain-containing protein [Aurantivibrio plasticivorans]
MKSSNFRLLSIAVFTAIACGCSHYTLTLNDQPISSVKPISTVENFPDKHLYDCVNQHLHDNHFKHPEELTTLNCSFNRISSLEGIQQLTNIRQLSLKDNQLIAIAILSQLPQLSWLDVSLNPELDCEHIDLIAKTLDEGLEVIAPAHCEHNNEKGFI